MSKDKEYIVDETQYAEISHAWEDIWKKEDVSVSYRFSKPTVAQVKRMQATAAKKADQAAERIVLDTIHPDDKERMLKDAATYPFLITSLSGALVKACGLADLGN